MFSLVGKTVNLRKTTPLRFKKTQGKRKYSTFEKVVDEQIKKCQEDFVDKINMKDLHDRKHVIISVNHTDSLCKNYLQYMTEDQKSKYYNLSRASINLSHRDLYPESKEHAQQMMKECMEYIETGNENYKVSTTFTFQDKIQSLKVCSAYPNLACFVTNIDDFNEKIKKLQLHTNIVRSSNVYLAAYCIDVVGQLISDPKSFLKYHKFLLELSWFVTQHNYVFKHTNDLVLHRSVKYAKFRVVLNSIFIFLRDVIMIALLTFITLISYFYIRHSLR